MNRRHFLKFLWQGLCLLAVAPTKLLASVPVKKPEVYAVNAMDPIIEFRRVPGYEPLTLTEFQPQQTLEDVYIARRWLPYGQGSVNRFFGDDDYVVFAHEDVLRDLLPGKKRRRYRGPGT